MTKNFDLLPLPKSLNEDQKNGEELRISQLHSEVLNATRSSFVILQKEAVGFYINIYTKSAAFPAHSLSRFGEKLLKLP